MNFTPLEISVCSSFPFLGVIASEVLLTLVQLNGNLCMAAGNGENKTFFYSYLS